MSNDSTPTASPFTFAVSTEHLARPAIVLVQKISDAVGTLYEPFHVERMAKAKANAKIIAAEGRIELTDLHRRAITRWANEEAQKQANMESVIAQIFPLLDATASPEQIDNDWIRLLFEKARLVSNADMQEMWAKVVARQANLPNSFSIHAVYALALMDKADGDAFTRACQLVALVDGVRALLVFGADSEFSVGNGTTGAELRRLEELGLVRIERRPSFNMGELPNPFLIEYGKWRGEVRFTQPIRSIMLGHANYTSIGWQLSGVVHAEPSAAVWEYLRNRCLNQSHLEIVSWDSID